MGSYTYQMNTRDSFGFAIKATHAVINGEEDYGLLEQIFLNGQFVKSYQFNEIRQNLDK